MGYSFLGSQRVRHDFETEQQQIMSPSGGAEPGDSKASGFSQRLTVVIVGTHVIGSQKMEETRGWSWESENPELESPLPIVREIVADSAGSILGLENRPAGTFGSRACRRGAGDEGQSRDGWPQ